MCKLHGVTMLIWNWLRRNAWLPKTSALRSLISAIAATCDLQHMLCFIPKGKILILQIQERNAFLTGTFRLIQTSFLQWYTQNSGSRKTGCTNGSVNTHMHLEVWVLLPFSDFLTLHLVIELFGKVEWVNSSKQRRGKLFSRVYKAWNQIQIQSL